jgi:hypothetical protein
MSIVDGGDAFSTYDGSTGGGGDSYSKTAQMVATDVQNKFGDTGQVQITNDMLLSWINAGQQEIGSTGLTIEDSATMNLLAGVTTYDLSLVAASIRNISQVMVNGVFAEVLQWPEFSEFVGSNTQQSAYSSVASLYAGKLVLWPSPSESIVQGLNIFFTAYPAELPSLTSTLTVPDRYFQALCDWVLAQALELDENFDAGQVKLGHYENRITKQLARTHESPSAYYHDVEPTTELM